MTTTTHSHKRWTDKGGHVTPAPRGAHRLWVCRGGDNHGWLQTITNWLLVRAATGLTTAN